MAGKTGRVLAAWGFWSKDVPRAQKSGTLRDYRRNRRFTCLMYIKEGKDSPGFKSGILYNAYGGAEGEEEGL